MTIGKRIRAMRVKKGLSQGDIEKRSGLLRCYISQVEHNHTVPTIGTVEKIAKALQCPLYQMFCETDSPPPVPPTLKMESLKTSTWGLTGKTAKYFELLRRNLAKAQDLDRKLILAMAQHMARRRRKPSVHHGRRPSKRLLPAE